MITQDDLTCAISGIGLDVIMACTDVSIYSMRSDVDGYATHTWTMSAPEQIEAHILDIITKKLNKRHPEVQCEL